ncbi:MAG: ABC transporter ATP-binding protein [Eggerthellaceae bacterium]|nr:ABC transporter ATP-binding protein [Eggerthellaceae bacterium]
MRILRYLLEHKLALLVVVSMFVIQAFCDLSLPYFTSQIVDVGIQQSGVKDAVPESMSSETFERIAAQLPESDEALLRDAYMRAEDGLWKLGDVDGEARAALDTALSFPLAVGYMPQIAPDVDTAGAVDAYLAGTLSKQELLGIIDQAKESARANSPDSFEAFIAQQSIEAVKAEYRACGIDVFDVQLGYLIRIGLLMLLATLLALIVHCVMNFAACRTATKIGRDLRTRLFTKVVSFSDAEINRFSAASLITRGTNDIQLIQQLCLMFQRLMVYSPILAIGGIIMIAQTNVSMSWIIGLAIVLVVIVSGILMAITMPKFKIMQTLIDKVNLIAREMLTGMSVVRAFNRQTYEERRFNEANTALLGTQLFTNRAMAFMMPSMMLIMNAVSVVIVWIGSSYVDMGAIQTGDLIAFITYAMVIVSSFLFLGLIAIMIPRANVASVRVDEVIATSASIADAVRVYDGLIPDSDGAKIEFKDVCFAYADDSTNAIDHVSFTVPAGSTCAIIGPTGCGKTTILKLIERFFDVTSGQVLVDDVDVRELSQHKLHSLLGYVPQQAFLFSGTIATNVAYGDSEMSEERIEASLSIAQATDFVHAKENGLDEEVSQGGTNVSGGQRQRLAIARALATDAKAFLFDDSFSALDYKTDAALRRDLKEKLYGKTVLIVAQRIATIMGADQIIVLDEGRVVGCGTHAELLNSCETYREIALSQLSEQELFGGGEVA